jgi:Secretion system C-terminal sorting domain
MRHKKLKLTAILFIGLGLTELQAQEAKITAGGNVSGSGGTVSYSVGQVVYTTLTGTGGSVQQGVQQAYEIATLSIFEETSGIILNYSVYPNPAIDYLILKVENYDKENLAFQLFDVNGKLLDSKILTESETIIDMNNHVPSIYFLKIIDSQKDLKTFKIIKK